MKSHPHPYIKTVSAIVLVLIAVIIGYLAVYWWVFGDFQKAFDVSVLKNQIIARQNADDVKAQLGELGYSFSEDEFFQLNNPNSVNYRADVLGGYEPVKVEEPPAEDSYYFYDENGTAFFFVVGDDGEIDPDSFITLIRE